MSHLAERPVFSARYGILPTARTEWDREHPWASRHAQLVQAPPQVPLCVCPGPVQHGTCSQRMTQEDFFCDECREWCWAVTDAGTFKRFTTVNATTHDTVWFDGAESVGIFPRVDA